MSYKIQGSPEWLNMRRGKIMASDAPCIMGVGFKSAQKLYEHKMTGEDTYVSPAMQRGKDLEPIALRKYIQTTGIFMEPDVVFHPFHSWMGASLDGISMDGSMAVEIKCPNQKDHEIAKQGKIPDKYYPQLQHQLEVLGIDMMHYYSFDGEDGIIVEVFKDKKYIEKLIEAEEEFYECMLHSIPPCNKGHVEMETQMWYDEMLIAKDIANREKILKSEIKLIESEKEAQKERLKSLSNGQSAMGHGLKFTIKQKKGLIDYKKIPGFESVDLPQYRKAPVISYTVSLEK